MPHPPAPRPLPCLLRVSCVRTSTLAQVIVAKNFEEEVLKSGKDVFIGEDARSTAWHSIRHATAVDHRRAWHVQQRPLPAGACGVAVVLAHGAPACDLLAAPHHFRMHPPPPLLNRVLRPLVRPLQRPEAHLGGAGQGVPGKQGVDLLLLMLMPACLPACLLQ